MALNGAPMKVLRGTICPAGVKDMPRRMCEHPKVFEEATGEPLYPGTINVDVGEEIKIKEDFRIHGRELNEAEDFLFELCHFNGIRAYRIRPLDAAGGGGHGDHIIEITCSQKIPNVSPGTQVEITLFQRD